MRVLVRLLLLVALANLVPTAAHSTAGITTAITFTPPPISFDQTLPDPTLAIQIPPQVDPQLPSLVVQVAIADPVLVGDTMPFTITIHNQAPYPANDLAVQLPLPEGATVGTIVTGASAPAAPTASDTTAKIGWTWAAPLLEAQTTITFTGALQFLSLPASGAVVLTPQVTAKGLAVPVFGSGGALVIDPTVGRGTARFDPSVDSRLSSADGRVTVTLDANASKTGLNLSYERLADATPDLVRRGALIPSKQVTDKRNLGVFVLEAIDDTGTQIHQFDTPLTIEVHYTPEQLQALGISPLDLNLYWFDEAKQAKGADGSVVQGAWVPLLTQVDTAAGLARATVTHFSPFSLSDGSSPSEAYLPSVQGWQVSTFTGAASYSIPIEVPVGPAGLKPKLELSYSSAATDGAGGLRTRQQAGWVGKGWSLDVGAIALNRRVRNSGTDLTFDSYDLTLNGKSYSLVQGAPVAGTPAQKDPTGAHCTNFRKICGGVGTVVHR